MPTHCEQPVTEPSLVAYWNFDDDTQSMGITGSDGKAAWGDYDNDGWVDAFDGRLWHSEQGKRFTQIELPVNGQGIWGDFDNDGHIDLFVGNFSHAPAYQDRCKFYAATDRLVKITKGEVPPLEVLSAYYMPDPRPPADSNVVEGELKPANVGKTFEPLQQLYTDHADFGGARVVLRNTKDEPVRIGEITLNGRAIEEHYVDFLDSEWDDRGVVWYRVRPRIVDPGGSAQVYILDETTRS